MARPSREDAARGVWVLKYRKTYDARHGSLPCTHAKAVARCAARQTHISGVMAPRKNGAGACRKTAGNECVPLIPLLLLHASPRTGGRKLWKRGRLPCLGRARSLWLEAPPRNYGLSKLICPRWAGSACRGCIRCCGPLQWI